MAFLTPAISKKRAKPIKRRTAPRPTPLSTEVFKQNPSDDDMLIVDDNDEIVRTCKTVEMSEEDEYIYETLDDPDSALEIMKGSPSPQTKPTAIRSGGAARIPPPVRPATSGRIRRLTPKMQNSIIAKKLKQAQQILQQSNIPSSSSNKKPTALQKVMISNKKPHTEDNAGQGKAVLYQDKTTRHIATVNPNIIRVENIAEKRSSFSDTHNDITQVSNKKESETSSPEGNRPFKVIKLKGRNPIIFSPDKLSDIQSLLKSESSPIKEQNDVKTPLIKVKSVDNLNNPSPSNSGNGDNSNLDIIHSVGLVRKGSADKSTDVEKIQNQNYSRAYSWNRPTVKVANKQTTTEKIQADSQTKDYEIEETWNDIKEENIDDYESWPHVQETETSQRQLGGVVNNTEALNKAKIWNRVTEAKLESIEYQRKLLEEQHKKTMEYMKKEHDLKMTLLKAEIDLKRKQLNIML